MLVYLTDEVKMLRVLGLAHITAQYYLLLDAVRFYHLGYEIYDPSTELCSVRHQVQINPLLL